MGVSWAVGHLWRARKGAREGLKIAEKMDLGPTDSQERLGLVVRSRRTQQHLKTHPGREGKMKPLPVTGPACRGNSGARHLMPRTKLVGSGNNKPFHLSAAAAAVTREFCNQ